MKSDLTRELCKELARVRDQSGLQLQSALHQPDGSFDQLSDDIEQLRSANQQLEEQLQGVPAVGRQDGPQLERELANAQLVASSLSDRCSELEAELERVMHTSKSDAVSLSQPAVQQDNRVVVYKDSGEWARSPARSVSKVPPTTTKSAKPEPVSPEQLAAAGQLDLKVQSAQRSLDIAQLALDKVNGISLADQPSEPADIGTESCERLMLHWREMIENRRTGHKQLAQAAGEADRLANKLRAEKMWLGEAVARQAEQLRAAAVKKTEALALWESTQYPGLEMGA